MLPGYIYLSPEVFALERSRLFMKGWLCVARVEELPATGDYLAIHIAREPVLLARNKAGEIRSFSNMCAHRGAQIASGSGNVMRFSCPYHGWSYDLDGRLTGAAYMNDASGFSRESCRLPPLLVTESQGWIHVNFDEAAAPFQPSNELLQGVPEVSSGQALRLANRFDLQFDCNWKHLLEQVLLRSLASRRRGVNVSVISADSQGSISRVPASGMPAPRRPGSDHADNTASHSPDEIATVVYSAPNVCTITWTDHVVRLVSWPASPQKSLLAVYVLSPGAVRDGPGAAEQAHAYKEQLREWLNDDSGEAGSEGAAQRLDAAFGGSVRHYFERVFS